MIQTEHKGFKINYDEKKSIFVVEDNDALQHAGLTKLKKMIDRQLKKKFNRVTVLFEKSWRENKTENLVKGEVTGPAGKYCSWTSTGEQGSRSKQSNSKIYLDNDDNREKINTLKEKEAQLVKLKEQIRLIWANLKRYDPVEHGNAVEEDSE